MTMVSPRQPLFAIQRANTILYCAHWPATVAFYRDQLGLPVTYANDWFVELLLGEGRYLSLANSARATIPPGRGAGLTLSWQVTAIATLQQQLQQVGIATTPLKVKWGAQVLYFHDPEGHRIELWEAL
ncbi:MAG: VOC family protein [Caldilineaceae bacterium]|nr:VOC family protein [Caldilineaceae bacterium]